MKARFLKNIESISVLALLIASSLVIAFNNGAQAEQAPANTAVSSSSDGVSAASGSNRFVVWQDGIPGNSEIFFRRSTDNGATWQPTFNVSNNPGSSLFPRIAVSGSHVYVIWVQFNSEGQLPNIFFRHSPDNGISWGSKIKISTSGTVGTVHPGNQQQALQTSGSNVYVLWKESGDIISFRRSNDNGVTWKPIIMINDHARDNTQVDLAAAGSNVYAVWTSTGTNAFFTRSTNNGATWGADVSLAGGTGGGFCPKIEASGLHVYVIWQKRSQSEACQSEHDLHDIMFRRSTDSGATWKPVVNLSNTPNASSFQQIAVSGSNVYVVWTEGIIDSEIFDVEIFFRRSTDNGATWKSTVNLSNNPGPSKFPEIAVSGSNVYVVWQQENSEGDLPNVFFKRSTNNGATWATKVNLSNTGTVGFAFAADVAALGSNVYVAWMDLTTGNSEIFLRRSTDSGAGFTSVENLSNNSGGSCCPQIAV